MAGRTPGSAGADTFSTEEAGARQRHVIVPNFLRTPVADRHACPLDDPGALVRR
jgi:hypothetical protein